MNSLVDIISFPMSSLTKLLSQQAVLPRKVRDLSITHPFSNGLWHGYRSTCKDKELKAVITWTLSLSVSQVHIKCCNRNICVHFQSVSLLSNIKSALGHCIALLCSGWNWTTTSNETVQVCGYEHRGTVGRRRFQGTDGELLLNEIKSLLRLRPVSCIELHRRWCESLPPRANDLQSVVDDDDVNYRCTHCTETDPLR